MDKYISWIQLTITGGLLGAFIVIIRGSLDDLKNKFNEKFKEYKDYNRERLEDVKNDVGRELSHISESVTVAHNRINEANKERGILKDKAFSEEKHDLICDGRIKDLKMYVSADIKRLGDSIFASLDGLKKDIEQLNQKFERLDGRTGFLKDKQ